MGVSIQSINNWENDKTLPDLDNLVKLSRYYDVDIIGLIIKEDVSDEAENLITVEGLNKGGNILSKNSFSLVFNIFVVIASIFLVFIFIYKGFDIYLCLIPLSVLFCGVVSLYVDVKKRKNTLKK